MLLLGAVRCMDACQLPDRQPVKSCHQTPDSPQHPTAKTCGQLTLEAPPVHDGVDAPALLEVSHSEPRPEAATATLNGRVPTALARPGPPLLPLRL